MILFSAYVGLRKGEMLALLGSDIDFREGVVTIERSYTSKTGSATPCPTVGPNRAAG